MFAIEDFARGWDNVRGDYVLHPRDTMNKSLYTLLFYLPSMESYIFLIWQIK